MSLYEEVLNEIKNIIEKKTNLEKKYLVSNGTNNGFECLVTDILKNEFNKNKFSPHSIEFDPKFGKHFPDINVSIDNEQYGLELKSSQQNTWKVNGGSVFESVGNEQYKDIYVLFGSRKKTDKTYNIRYKPYWSVADGIHVTHSPRYSLNMDAKQEDLFYPTKNDYDNIRQSDDTNKLRYFKEKLAKVTNKPTWYSNELIEPKSFNELSATDKENIISESLIIYPQDVIKEGHANYYNITKYMITTYFVFNASIRDTFTAGGKYKYENKLFPQIVKTLKKYNEVIQKRLEDPDIDSEFKKTILNSWQNIPNFDINNNNSLYTTYLELINFLGNKEYQNLLNSKKLANIIFELQD